MTAQTSLERWLSKAILFVPSDGSTIDRIVVRHASGGMRAPEVESVKVSDPTELSAAKLAARIFDAAEQDADGLGGSVQRYVCHAYYGASREPECGRCVFAVHREDEMSGGTLDTEPPNATGLVAQALRHNEANARITMGATQVVVGQMTRLIEMQASRIQELESQLHEARMSGDELALQREEAKRVAEKEDRRDKVLFESLQTIAPIVLAKLSAQGGAAPQLPQAAKDVVVDKLLSSVTQEQFAQLQAILNTDQLALFVAAYETRVIDKEAPAPPPASLAKVNGHGGQA